MQQSQQLEKLKFPALRDDGSNYLVWATMAKNHLVAMKIDHTIKEDFSLEEDHGISTSPSGVTTRSNSNNNNVVAAPSTGVHNITKRAEAAQAFCFLIKHLSPILAQQFLAEERPNVIWKSLKNRFDHQRVVLKPSAIHDWTHLRFMDFGSVAEYNNALNEVVSRLRLCQLDELITDESLIDKTLSTFPSSLSQLAETIYSLKFNKYTDLLAHLLGMEQRQSILMKNTNLRPAGSSAPPVGTKSSPAPTTLSIAGAASRMETLNTDCQPNTRQDHGNNGNNRGRGGFMRRGHFGRRGRGHGSFGSRRFGHRGGHHRGGRHGYHGNGNRSGMTSTTKGCHKCGTVGHFAYQCRTPNHLVNLYQKSIGKIESNKVEVAPKIDVGYSFLGGNTGSDGVTNIGGIDGVGNGIGIGYGNGAGSSGSGNVLEINMTMLDQVPLFEDFCILDSGTTYTVLQDEKFFVEFTTREETADLHTLAPKPTQVSHRRGKARLWFPNGTRLICEEAIYMPTARQNLVSYKDFVGNGYGYRNDDEDGYVLLLTDKNGRIIEKFNPLPNGLHYTQLHARDPKLKSMETLNSNILVDSDPSKRRVVANRFTLWHQRLGHPSNTVMRRMIQNDVVQALDITPVDLNSSKGICVPCIEAKYSHQPHYSKDMVGDLPDVFEELHFDWSGPYDPPAGKYRYFLICVCKGSRYIKAPLIDTRNNIFPNIVYIIIAIRTQHPEKTIKKIKVDNAGEFSSQLFDQFCKSLGIKVEYSLPYVHETNGLAEAHIKRVQIVVRSLLRQSNLPISAWGHAVSHATDLLNMRPVGSGSLSPSQMVNSKIPNVSHIRTFGCAVWIPEIPNNNKFGPRRTMGIYVGFISQSIIKYLDVATGNLHRARFADCEFDETTFPSLGGGMQIERREFAPDPRYSDSPSSNRDAEIYRILNLHNLSQLQPNAFIGIPRQMLQSETSHTPTTQTTKRKRAITTSQKPSPSNNGNLTSSLEPRRWNLLPAPSTQTQITPTQSHSQEILVHSTVLGQMSKKYDRNKDALTDPFCLLIASIISDENEEDPRTVEEAMKRSDWAAFQEAMNDELMSLIRHDTFEEPVELEESMSIVGLKWVLTRKRNEKNEVIRYKARLVAQGYTQQYGVDYYDTYSPVMDMTTYRLIISIAVEKGLNTEQMDVITAYLYGPLEETIYARIPAGLLELKNEWKEKVKLMERPVIRVKKSLYGLKQSASNWNHTLMGQVLDMGFESLKSNPCLFVKAEKGECCIITTYVDDLNLVGTPKAIQEAKMNLKKVFDMKELGMTKFCIGVQIEHLKTGKLMHQGAYIDKLLKKFHMDKSHPVKTPLAVRRLEPEHDQYGPLRQGEQILAKEVPYMAAIGALLYLANLTRPDISFAVSLLARHTTQPTQRHWVGVKQILRYLKGTSDYGLYFHNDTRLVGYADAGYLSDMTRGRSQTGYVFLRGGAAISWKSTKQPTAATSSNHAEIIALHEASRESLWLRETEAFILRKCKFGHDDSPTIIYEDNAACIAQIKKGYIRSDRTKHINPKFWFTSDLDGTEIDIRQVSSTKNIADIFTKTLPSSSHWQLMHELGLRSLKRLLSVDSDAVTNDTSNN